MLEYNIVSMLFFGLKFIKIFYVENILLFLEKNIFEIDIFVLWFLYLVDILNIFIVDYFCFLGEGRN